MAGETPGALFPRHFARRYPVAVRGQGVYLFDAEGRRYLDACGGAAVVSIGHGVAEVADALRRQAAELPYVHSSQFHTRAAAELAALLGEKFPGSGGAGVRVFFTSGGSEATETAIKIVRQYWLARGEPDRIRFLSRWQSYHGSTLGALGLSGHAGRRHAYEPLLPPVEHIAACFCYRCPLELSFPACELACARELESAIARVGEKTVAGFILEPVVGAASGAVPPEGYLRTVREICDAHGLPLIADEIMAGAGRTGKYFAAEHWGLVPDLILLGKGLSSGYAPLGAVLVGEKIWRAIERGPGTLDHGFTYQAHPPSVAAGLAVQRYLDQHNLVEHAAARGEFLARALERLRRLPAVGDVRGRGLLQTVEFVADAKTREPFPKEFRFSDRLYQALLARGVLVYPLHGTVEGGRGDHILLAPPFVITESEIETLAAALESAVAEVTAAAA